MCFYVHVNVCICMCVSAFSCECICVYACSCSFVLQTVLTYNPHRSARESECIDSISVIGPLTCVLPSALFCHILSLKTEWCFRGREHVCNTDRMSGISGPECRGAMKTWRYWQKWQTGCPPRFKPESSSPLNVS